MTEIEVRIVQLDPIRVAAAQGFGVSPEQQAWDMLSEYIRKTGLLADGQTQRFFGFNNPDPSPGSPNYGYEQWVTVGAEAQPEEGIQLKDFGGGLYAVTRTRLADIGQTWQALAAWREASRYRFGSQQWLEEALNFDLERTVDEIGPENFLLDLYMPIAA